ncbi:hypothetical protein [Streptomyces sp. NBC_00259]|jgi:hypothetical protein|uniref:hypothetical protein n=1 Tax=Streptomyces sp. NBC_00259 TaxID=2903643 RepID=UPI002E2B2121|nr:hypothetical protein [Streptomyces sp. NBC_00259]
MRNRDTDTSRDTQAGGLTTDDLAHPRSTAAAESPPPAYPGEATPDTAGRAPEAAPEEAPEAASDLAPEPAPEPAATDGQPLIPAEAAEDYRDRWQEIQGTFVDDPKDSVRAADALVAEVIQSLAATFADNKQDLEAQWSRGEEIETEGLRVALQRYRTFFNQLLHA